MSQWLAEALRTPVQAWLLGKPHLPQPLPHLRSSNKSSHRTEAKRGQHDTISWCEGFPELQQATAQSKPAAGGGEAKKEEKKAKRKPARFELRSVQDSGSLLSQGAFHLVLVNAENLPNGLCLRARTGRGGGRGGGDGLRPLRLSVSGQQQGSLWPHPLEHGGAHPVSWMPRLKERVGLRCVWENRALRLSSFS